MLSDVLRTAYRLCGSGFQTIINAAQEIKLGEADVVLTGGAEQMSLSPCKLNLSAPIEVYASHHADAITSSRYSFWSFSVRN
jgi:acetyl-CoA acetyltransferase